MDANFTNFALAQEQLASEQNTIYNPLELGLYFQAMKIQTINNDLGFGIFSKRWLHNNFAIRYHLGFQTEQFSTDKSPNRFLNQQPISILNYENNIKGFQLGFGAERNAKIFNNIYAHIALDMIFSYGKGSQKNAIYNYQYNIATNNHILFDKIKMQEVA